MIKRPKVGLPQRPNAGVTATYRKRLDCLIDATHRSLLYWLCARWKSNPPHLAADENPAMGMRRAMRVLRRRWESKWDEAAPKLADYLARQALRHATRAMEMSLERGQIPTIDFKVSPGVRDAFNSIVAENVSLIESIGRQHLTAVEGAVYRSVSVGRDLASLAEALEHQHGVTKRRAAFISRDMNSKATTAITRIRMIEANIGFAVWEHSHAGRYPRKEHVAFSGKTYDVKRGALLEGVWTWPGHEINCRCFARPVLEGF